MNINIDFDKINKIYGIETLNNIKENINEVNKNISYMYKLGFTDIEDIFERETLLFICDNKEFKNKIDKLIRRLGATYVNDIENDLSLLEELE